LTYNLEVAPQIRQWLDVAILVFEAAATMAAWQHETCKLAWEPRLPLNCFITDEGETTRTLSAVLLFVLYHIVPANCYRINFRLFGDIVL